MGDVEENIRTFTPQNEPENYTFRMSYNYYYHLLTEIVYPDQEKVVYAYDRGGQLSRITSSKNGNDVDYVKDIFYDKYGQREEVHYGNGARSLYAYDTLRRLSRLQSFTAQNEAMQEITYAYDAVDNITDIANYAQRLSNGLGGEYKNSYAYDNLYRLVT